MRRTRIEPAGCAGFPGWPPLRRYESSWLRHDLVAGLVMTTMLVPVGIAYAEASGRAGHQRPLRDDRAAARVRAVRSEPHPRPRPGLRARGRDPGRRAAALGGRSAACGRAGRSDGDRLRRRVRRRGPGAPRLHHRAALEADPLRLHERHRADRDAEPDPEALRLLGQRGRTAAPGMGHRREGARGQHERRGVRDRRRHARADPAAEALAARAGHPDRRRRRHGRRRRCSTSPRAPACRCSVLCRRDCRRRAFRSSRSTTSCRSSWAASRSRSCRSPTRACFREPTRRVCARRSIRTRRWWASASPTSRPAFFQGFPISSSSSRTPVAEAAGAKTQLTGVVGALADRAAAAVRARAAPGSAAHRPGRRRHRVGDRPDRSVRPAPHLSHPALGVLAVDGLLRGRGGVRRHSGHRARDRDRRDRVPLGRLAPAFGRARPRRPRQGLSRHHPLSGGAADPGPRAVPLGCAALLRQRRAVPRARAGRGRELADAGALARGRGRAGHQRRRHRRRRRLPSSTTRCTPPASSCASPR